MNRFLTSDFINRISNDYNRCSLKEIIYEDFVEKCLCKFVKLDFQEKEFTNYFEAVDKSLDLIIKGIRVGGINYIENFRYKYHEQNKYNDYVNLFGLWDILTEEGKRFAIDMHLNDFETKETSLNFEIERCQATINEDKAILEKLTKLKNYGKD